MGQVLITKAQDGENVRLRVGDTVVIELAENPTTGFRWAFDKLDDLQIGVEASDFRGADGKIGGGGVASWTLCAFAGSDARRAQAVARMGG